MALSAASRDINFDEIDREIAASEDYLRGSLDGKPQAGNNSTNVRRSVQLDDARKADILKQLGRRPFGGGTSASYDGKPSVEGSSSSSSKISNGMNDEQVASTRKETRGSESIFDNSHSYRYAVPDKADSDDDSDFDDNHYEVDNRQDSPDSIDESRDSRYSMPLDRERLISRLVAEHNVKNKLSSSNVSTERAYVNGDNSRDIDDNYNDNDNDNDTYTYRDEDNDNDDSKAKHEEEVETLFFASDLDNNWLGSGSGSGSGAASEGKKKTRLLTRPHSAPATRTALKHDSRASDDTFNFSRANIKHATSIDSMHGGSSLSGQGQPGNGKKYRLTRDELRQEAEKSFKETCAFKPLISEKVRRRERKIVGERGISSRIEEMQRAHDKLLKSRAQQKKDLENVEMLECTFQPKLSKGTNIILRNKAAMAQENENDLAASMHQHVEGGGEVDVSQRLHEEAEQRMLQQRWLEKRVTEARMSHFTFTPNINPRTSAMKDDQSSLTSEHKPIYERVSELQRERNRRLQELRSSVEEAHNQSHPFAPQIDNKSRRMVERKRYTAMEDSRRGWVDGMGANEVANRLLNEGRRMAREKQKLAEEREIIESQNMQPVKLSKGSERIAQRNQKIGTTTFDERQQLYKERIKENMEARQKRLQEEGASWFKPSIGSSAAIAVQTRPDRESETPEERALRLSVVDKIEIDTRRKEIEDEVYGQITFTPKIDPVSKAMGRSSGISELYKNDRGKRAMEIARKKVEAAREEECPFHPTINQYPYPGATSGSASTPTQWEDDNFNTFGWASCPIEELENGAKENMKSMSKNVNKAVSSSRDYPARPRSCINLKQPEKMVKDIMLHMHEKEEKRRGELVAREIEELRDCTFHPSIQPYQPSGDECVVVRGLGRHLELKHLTQVQKAEAAQREREVFSVKGVDQFRRKEDGTTIVKPFVFHESNRRHSKAVKELYQKENNELTFAPHTHTSDQARRQSLKGRLDWI